MQQTQEEVVERIRNIIAETTGNDISDIFPDTLLDDELEITTVDFKRIVAAINNEYQIELNPDELLEEDINTVIELAMVVREETELS